MQKKGLEGNTVHDNRREAIASAGWGGEGGQWQCVAMVGYGCQHASCHNKVIITHIMSWKSFMILIYAKNPSTVHPLPPTPNLIIPLHSNLAVELRIREFVQKASTCS